MAYADVALLKRFILIDTSSAISIRINGTDVITLNAGRYQFDRDQGIKRLEIDGSPTVQQSPVGLGFLTSINGLPVSGPLTDAQLRDTLIVQGVKKVFPSGTTQGDVFNALTGYVPNIGDGVVVEKGGAGNGSGGCAVVGFYKVTPTTIRISYNSTAWLTVTQGSATAISMDHYLKF